MKQKKASWKHNKIQNNPANQLLPDKADSTTATKRNVSGSGASRKNKVAVNTAAVKRADDRSGSVGTNKRREATPAAFYLRPKAFIKAKPFLYGGKKKNWSAGGRPRGKVSPPALRLASLCAKKWNTF